MSAVVLNLWFRLVLGLFCISRNAACAYLVRSILEITCSCLVANVQTMFYQPGRIWYNLWVNLSQQYFLKKIFFNLSTQHRDRTSSKHRSSSPKAKEAKRTTQSAATPVLLTHPPAQLGIPSLWGPGTCTSPRQQSHLTLKSRNVVYRPTYQMGDTQ